jgi:hypothetical protein
VNEYEADIAERVRLSVNQWSNSTERSEQAAEFRLGPSDVGYCSERVRRMLDRQVPTDPVDWQAAFIGTVLGDGLETAYKAMYPDALTQAEFTVTIETDTRTFTMLAHADLILPGEGTVLDFKAKNGLEMARRYPVPQSHHFQRTLYALGAHQAGYFGDRPLEDVKVGNIYYDRSGVEATPHVQVEQFSHDVLYEAISWLDEVVYSFLNGEEARKEPAAETCAKHCGFYSVCRAYDTDVEGVIRDPEKLTAIEMALEARELESRAKRLKNQAQVALKDTEGHTETHSLRWTQINGGRVEYERPTYLRMDLRKRK